MRKSDTSKITGMAVGVTFLNKTLLAQPKRQPLLCGVQDTKHTTAGPAKRTVTSLQLSHKTHNDLRLEITT